MVRVLDGEAGEPTANERCLIDAADLARGDRLACQIRPRGDLRVRLLKPKPQAPLRPLEPPRGRLRRRAPGPYGVAVDLGTSHVRVSVQSLETGDWIGGCCGINPQQGAGIDVVSRLMAAAESPAQARKLSEQAISIIGETLWETAAQTEIRPGEVTRLLLVGNAAMLVLLTRARAERQLMPRHWGSAVEPPPLERDCWQRACGFGDAVEIDLVPPVAGFIGSDLMAALLSTRLCEGPSPALLIDFGTNSELALWDGARLWTTSAAGGPAFEGCGIRQGMPAERGAIDQFSLLDGKPSVRVIGGGAPRGICGSGLVDMIAALRADGRLTAVGRFDDGSPYQALALDPEGQTLRLYKTDVDAIQRAKAAIGAGIQALLATADLRLNDMQRVCVAGTFGASLNVRSAQAIGLLPCAAPERIEFHGNAALAGCEEALRCAAARTELQRLSAQTQVLSLAELAGFDDLFLDHLYLQPLSDR
jgi:uncharacterized 2Fe-2S/4Fe-4S cluster protein (DUF4445 family)